MIPLSIEAQAADPCDRFKALSDIFWRAHDLEHTTRLNHIANIDLHPQGPP
jgi:hypothetical protein